MKLKQFAITLLAASVISACSDDDNDAEVRELQSQVQALQTQLDEMNTNNSAEVTELENQILILQTALDDMTADSNASEAEIAALQADLDEMQTLLDAMTAKPAALGENATSGANILTEESDRVWRFAVFPDTQGRDDDNMKTYVNVDRDGNTLDVSEWIGVDYNKDGYYDAGTESQADSVKPGDWDEDGISYLVNVQDPFHPFIETDENGDPIVVAPEDRQDFGPDWKVIPLPLVKAVTDKMIELDVDLVLATGDITEYRAESDYVQWMETIAAPLQEAGISIFPARGNHEIVNGRNWPAWFSNEQEWERQSVNNVYNDINPYEGFGQDDYDQGYRLYQAYAGALVQEHLDNGTVVGYEGAEDLVYYFKHENTLFIALDFYFSELTNSSFKGTWVTLADWLEEVITTEGPNVDHIVAYGHEPLSTKKRPQTFDAEQYDDYLKEQRELSDAVDVAQTAYDNGVANGESAEVLAVLANNLEEAQSALAEVYEPGLTGNDIGQLGYLLQQDAAQPGLAEKVLNLFTQYQVNYIAGHDHQYARSLIHSDAGTKDQGLGFVQMIGGNASWKAYENLFGIHDEHETGLYINNFYDGVSGGDLVNSEGLTYANVTSSLGKGISFVVVEVNGRQITTKSYFADHSLTEVDMNLGAHYDYDSNSWCTFSGDYMVAGSETTMNCEAVQWEVLDEVTRTIDATNRVVNPQESYYAFTSTPEDQGYIGSEATIIDGYNLTYDSSYAQSVGRVERLSEMLSLSWFTDESALTLSDVLLISGNQTQDGTYYDYLGEVSESTSPSAHYINNRGCEVVNPTHVSPDGKFNKGTDIEASLTGNTNTTGSSNCANWEQRYDANDLDFADAMAISFKAPDSTNLTDLTVGRYDESSETWVPAFPTECYVETGYSDHFSVHYRISEQEPEGGKGIAGCQQRYWGYVKNSNSIWGFVHTDGKFAVIEK